MKIARLIMDSDDLDSVTLIVRGDVTKVLVLRNRHSALELNRLLTIAFFEDHQGNLTLEIDGHSHVFPEAAWKAALTATDEWLEKYLVSEGF